MSGTGGASTAPIPFTGVFSWGPSGSNQGNGGGGDGDDNDTGHNRRKKMNEQERREAKRRSGKFPLFPH